MSTSQNLAARSTAELADRVGDLRQLASVTPVVLTDGPAMGLRALLVRSAAGINFMVLADRGMDIGWAEVAGLPIAWTSAVGDVSPHHYDPNGSGWLRTFGGGLVTTCGLLWAGHPARDGEEDLGLHGRVSATPATHVTHDIRWGQAGCVIRVSGRIREASATGHVVEMRRTITTRLATPIVTIRDVVTNLGPRAAPHMFRYHANFGYPLVAAGARIECAADNVRGLAGAPPGGAVDWNHIGEPTTDGEDLHAIQPASLGDSASVTLRGSGHHAMAVHLSWSADSLPLLLVWRNLVARNYVVALEPSNCLDDGRRAARDRGELTLLAPGESVNHWLRIRVDLPRERPANAASTSSEKRRSL